MQTDSIMIGPKGGSTAGLTTTGGMATGGMTTGGMTTGGMTTATVSSSKAATGLQFAGSSTKLGLAKTLAVPSSVGVGALTLAGIGSVVLTGAVIGVVGLLSYAITKAALEP